MIEQALGAEGFAPVSVFYTLEYLALRPAYAFRLQADWESVHRYIEKKLSLNLIILKIDIKETFDELIQNGAIRIQSDTFIPENDDTREALRDKSRMVSEVQELLINAFFKTEIQPVKIKHEQGAFSFLPSFSYKIVDITQIDRRSLDMAMNERSTVRRRVYPQGQLQANLNPKHFVTRIDLDDPYFRTRQVEIICRANMKEDAIRAIVVTLEYGDDRKSVKFDPSTDRQTLVWNSIKAAQGTLREVQVKYTVYFEEAPGVKRPSSLTSSEMTTVLDYLEVVPRELYTIQPVPIFTPKSFPWDHYASVQVKLRYVDVANDIRLDATLFLDRTRSQQIWNMFRRDRDQSVFQYQLHYNGINGQNDVITPWLVGQDQVVVRNPFPRQRLLNVIPPDAWDGIREISVEVRYQDPGNRIREEQTLWFRPSESTDKTFRANLLNPEQRLIDYQVTMYFEDERVWVLPRSTTLGERLFLHPAMQAQRIVEIQAQDIDFATNQIVAMHVRVQHKEPRSGSTLDREFVFDSQDDRAHFYITLAVMRTEAIAIKLFICTRLVSKGGQTGNKQM